jgi:hypothetical protein
LFQNRKKENPMGKDTAFNAWKKRNGLTTEQASEILGLAPATLYKNSCMDSFDDKTRKIMELTDTIREKDEKIERLNKVISDLS